MALRPTGPLGAWVLGLLASAPFVLGAWVYCWGPDLVQGAASRGLLLYSAAMIAFMGGSRWGVEIARAPPRWIVLAPAIITPLAALTLSMSMVDLALQWRLGGFLFGFLALWLWDSISTDLPAWYQRLRTTVTLIACVSLGLALEHALRM
jgi:hypothetical protein